MRVLARHPGLEPGSALSQRPRIEPEILRKIAPGRIVLLNPVVFPGARPALDALLADDRCFHRLVNLEPDEALDAVTARKTRHDSFAMLPNTPRQVRCHARVQRAAGCASEDINARLPFHRRNEGQGGSRIKSG